MIPLQAKEAEHESIPTTESFVIITRSFNNGWRPNGNIRLKPQLQASRQKTHDNLIKSRYVVPFSVHNCAISAFGFEHLNNNHVALPNSL